MWGPSMTEAEVFIAVVEEGSFSAAARKLGVLPSTVSRKITRLEERLSLRLLNRSTRAVSLTQLGSIYYEGARRIAQATRQLEAVVRDSSDELRGSIRIAIPHDAEVEAFSRIVSSFLLENPGAQVTLVRSQSLEDYIQQRVDIGLWIGELSDHDWTARAVAESVQCLMAAPRYLGRCGWPQSVDDLEDHHCIVARTTRAWVTFDGRSIRPNPSVFVGDDSLVLPLVREGTGIGLVDSRRAAQHLLKGTLIRVLATEVEMTKTVWLVYPRDRLFPPTARAFVEFCAAQFAEYSQEVGQLEAD